MKSYAFFGLLALAVLTACHKDDVVVCTPAASAGFDSLTSAGPATQSYTFALNQAQQLHTLGGAVIRFGANAFVLPSGAVATGMATLRVRELRTVGDMVLAGLHTNLQGNPSALLVSAGEFNLQVWQGNTRLRWQPVAVASQPPLPTLATPVPTTGLDTTRMYLWKLPFPANTAPDTMGWQPVRQAPQGFWNPILANNGFYTAALPLDTISWLNFDQYWRPVAPANWTWARVQVPAGAVESRVYIRPVGYTSLSRTFPVANDPTLWTNHLPDGTPVQVIVLQFRDGQLYFGVQAYTWRQGAVMTPQLQALSAADVAQRLRQL